MTILLPRLPSIAAEHMLDNYFRNSPPEWSGFMPTRLPDSVRFAAVGGTMISPTSLEAIRSGILALACGCGFAGAGKSDHARFDAEAAAWLVDCPFLSHGEALREDVWSFFGVVMFPDIVCWRFGNARERYLGGVRNTFQRLWLRACAIDRGSSVDDRWGLLRDLTEDAFVQIIERPSIGGNRILALAIAEAWVRAATKFGRGQMESIMRHAVLRIRILNEVRSLSSLDAKVLAELIDNHFNLAAASNPQVPRNGVLNTNSSSY